MNILKQKAETETRSCGAVHILWQWVCCRSAYKTVGGEREREKILGCGERLVVRESESERGEN